MNGFLAWLATFWAIGLPTPFLLGIDDWFASREAFMANLLVAVVAWTVANKAERAANRYYHNRRNS